MPDQEWLKSELDDCMHQIWFNAEIEQIDRMIYYIMSEGIPVDYQVFLFIILVFNITMLFMYILTIIRQLDLYLT